MIIRLFNITETSVLTFNMKFVLEGYTDVVVNRTKEEHMTAYYQNLVS